MLGQKFGLLRRIRIPWPDLVGPLTYGAFASEKATGSGAYLTGAPNTATPAPAVWGLRIVVSSSMDEGTALVGAFRRGARGGRGEGHSTTPPRRAGPRCLPGWPAAP